MNLPRHCFLTLFAFLMVMAVRGQGKGDYYTSFDGSRIYYEVNGSGPVVALVHGFIVTGESWKKTALYADLLQKGFRVVTMDMRGNGKSDKPHDSASYSGDAEAKDIIGLMKFLGVNRYIPVGYSRGSIITSRLMVLDPAVTAAVMGGMGSEFTNPEWPRRKMFYRALSGDSVPELAPMVKYVKESGLDQQALAMLQKEQPSTSAKELSAIRIPVLVIAGDHDSDNGSASTLSSLIPNSRFREVPGDHNNAYRSKEFSDSVIAFIQTTLSGQ